MDKGAYLSKLKNPDCWFDQAFSQKMVADKIINEVIMKRNFLVKLKETRIYDDYVGLWSNALYHYGIGIENGLKGIIIKLYPEAVNFEMIEEGVILHDIGGKASKSHDLYALANRAGILGKNKKNLPFNADVKLTKNVLQNLSDIIRWASRYPIPVNSSKIFQLDEDVPYVCVYGFHILDTIESFFDYFKLQVENNIQNDNRRNT